MVFEKATPDDIAELSALRTAYLLEDYGEISPEVLSGISARLPDYFRAHLNRDLFVYVCRDGREIAGCCFLLVTEKPANPAFPTGRTGTVLNVYTKPALRKKGIAGTLLKKLLSEAEDLALDYVELKATEQACALYRSLGFEEVSEKYRSMKAVIGREV